MLLILSTKGEPLNSFSAEQCSIIENRSKFAIDFVTQTDQFHAPITFSQDNILKIIQSSNPEKSHGPKKIIVDMIKHWYFIMETSSDFKSCRIFKSCITKSEFPSECKNANVVPVHRKNKAILLKVMSATFSLVCFLRSKKKLL